MATAAEARIVNVAGLVQGIALVTFPAASSIFTSSSEYGLSSTAYAAMFIPQAVTAVTASLLGARWATRFGTRKLYFAGLIANLAAMTLLVISAPLADHEGVAYVLLLAATASLGTGFGFTVPALNTFSAAFHPGGVDSAVLVLNALLGLGTALAPVFVAVFVGLGAWWLLPVSVAALLVALLLVSSRLALVVAPPEPARTAGSEAGAGEVGGAPPRSPFPARFWIYAAFAVLYGICETMNGNWGTIDMKDLGASTTEASLALTAFWASVTAGRVLFAAIRAWFPTRRTYLVLPFLLAGAFVIISQLPDDSPVAGIAAFALAGLGCSALIPLTISFSQEEFSDRAAAVAGTIIAFYQVGYGLAAFGAGPLQAAGASLSSLYGVSAVIAVVMGGLALVITHRRSGPARLHPRPATHLAPPTSG